MKTYEVEFTSTTCRSYHVLAHNKGMASEKATIELESDESVSTAWICAADITSISLEEQK